MNNTHPTPLNRGEAGKEEYVHVVSLDRGETGNKVPLDKGRLSKVPSNKRGNRGV